MATEKDIKVINGMVCITSNELIELLGVSFQTLTDWKQRGCPQIARNWWSIRQVFEWRGLISGSGVKTEQEVLEGSLERQKLYYEVKWKQSQTEAIELKNEISKGNYIAKQEIVAELQRYFVVLKKSLLGLPRKIGNEISSFIDPMEARRLENNISEIILDCLEQLSINGIYSPAKKRKK